jgi:hypothetical protein
MHNIATKSLNYIHFMHIIETTHEDWEYAYKLNRRLDQQKHEARLNRPFHASLKTCGQFAANN